MFYNRSHYAHKYASATLIHITLVRQYLLFPCAALIIWFSEKAHHSPAPRFWAKPRSSTHHSVEQNIFIRAHLHYSTTFHDLLGAFLPCLVRPLFTAYCTLFFFLAPENGVSNTPPSNTLYQLFLCLWWVYVHGREGLWSSFFVRCRERRGEKRSISFSWLRNTSLNVDSCLRRGSRSAWETWIKIKIKHQDQGPRPYTHACFAHKLIWQQIVASSWSILSKTLRSKHKHKHTKLHLLYIKLLLLHTSPSLQSSRKWVLLTVKS